MLVDIETLRRCVCEISSRQSASHSFQGVGIFTRIQSKPGVITSIPFLSCLLSSQGSSTLSSTSFRTSSSLHWSISSTVALPVCSPGALLPTLAFIELADLPSSTLENSSLFGQFPSMMTDPGRFFVFDSPADSPLVRNGAYGLCECESVPGAVQINGLRVEPGMHGMPLMYQCEDDSEMAFICGIVVGMDAVTQDAICVVFDQPSSMLPPSFLTVSSSSPLSLLAPLEDTEFDHAARLPILHVSSVKGGLGSHQSILLLKGTGVYVSNQHLVAVKPVFLDDKLLQDTCKEILWFLRGQPSPKLLPYKKGDKYSIRPVANSNCLLGIHFRGEGIDYRAGVCEEERASWIADYKFAEADLAAAFPKWKVSLERCRFVLGYHPKVDVYPLYWTDIHHGDDLELLCDLSFDARGVLSSDVLKRRAYELQIHPYQFVGYVDKDGNLIT